MSPSERPPAPSTLAQRIEQVEQRLVAREVRLRLGWQAFALQTQRRLEPARLALPLLGVALGGWAAWRSWHRPRVAAPPAGEAPAVRGWRAWLAPETVSLAAALLLPLLERCLPRRGAASRQGD